jgi:mono/diheme cytochrome c family protein
MTAMAPFSIGRGSVRVSPRLPWLVAFTLGALAGAPAAVADGGQSLVEQHCADCHTREGFALPGEPPTLPEMARRRSWSEGDLKAWLATDHARIPTPRLTSREFYEIERYLDALSREFPDF